LALPSRRFRLALAVALLAAGTLISCAKSIDQREAVHVLTADAEVNPVLARYIDRGIDEAERTDARAVVIKLDTPGGLVSSMEDIVQRIQSSKVPVIVFVSPAGAKAASAGTFITMSAPVAAMAPSTRIGAAHPIDASGGDIEGTLGEKVENDAAAYARSIAEDRGRNAEWAEDAVRNSVSASANEAVELDVVDFVARDVPEVLAQSDGMEVQVDGDQVTLSGLTEAPLVSNDMTFAERFLMLLSDPNIAFLLLSLGGLGLLIELVHPGVFAPGIFGIIMLVLAFFALGTLPVNWAGVALILIAFGLFAGEIFIAPGVGAFGIGGAIALIAGGLLLTTSDQADFQVSRWLVVGTGVVFAAFFLMVVMAVIRMRRMPVSMGIEAMIGQRATARSYLNPDGFVFIRGERWKAIAQDAPISEGTPVEVISVKGLTLTVKRAAGVEPQPG
ncbi:MAG TPA: nodulation protein NfeD, partial [Dehalococcoidia bacterium]|nr:nodulation protein NfeD [Dehalococcoidia bacterium]